MTDFIRLFRRTCIIIPAILLLAGAVAAGLMVSAAEGMPNLFPPDHNRNIGSKIIERNFEDAGDTAFKNSNLLPPGPVEVCDETNFSFSGCSMTWCEVLSTGTPSVDVDIPENTSGVWDGVCHCYRKYLSDSCTGNEAQVGMRIITNSSALQQKIVNDDTWSTPTLGYFARSDSGARFNETLRASYSAEKPLIEHFWEAGNTESFYVASAQLTMERLQSYSSCGWDDLCFCGSSRKCNLDNDWSSAGTLLLLPPSRRLQTTPAEYHRQLQTTPAEYYRHLQTTPATFYVPKVPKSKRGKVRVAFGLSANVEVQALGERVDDEAWSYLTSFEARIPWTQRNINDWCKGLAEEGSRDLRVTKRWCWMEDFKRYLQANGERFPVPAYRFDRLALDYIKSGQFSTPGLKYVWLVDGEIKAMYASIECDFNNNWDADKILAEKDKWQVNIDKFNSQAVASAKGAFHVSKSWVEAEATKQVIWSAIETLIILLVLAFLGMVTFTWSIALSLFVVGATLAVISGLSFFMVVAMQWEVGLIEVIAMVYFIGYAVTYSLHITHKYAHLEEYTPMEQHGGGMISKTEGIALGAGVGSLHEEPELQNPSDVRFARTKFAIKSMGAATVGSAATTAGASLYLCFATLTIFQRLGAMCLIVTLLSIYVALGPLPAFLLCCGPVRPGEGAAKLLSRCAWCLRSCGCVGLVEGMMVRLGLPGFDGGQAGGSQPGPYSGQQPPSSRQNPGQISQYGQYNTSSSPPPGVRNGSPPLGYPGYGKSSLSPHQGEAPQGRNPNQQGYKMQGHRYNPNGPRTE